MSGERRPTGRWIPLGRVGGLRFFLDPIFVVAVVLLVALGDADSSWSARLVLVAVLLVSVLWHELGHALAARALRLRVNGIYLHLLPFAYVERGSSRDELRVALAGPAASLLAAACLALGPHHLSMNPEAWAAQPLGFALLVNVLMGVVNLLPALPLDGGRALHALLRQRLSPQRARRIAWVVGFVVGAALVAWSFALGARSYARLPLFLGILLALMAIASARRAT